MPIPFPSLVRCFFSFILCLGLKLSPSLWEGRFSYQGRELQLTVPVGICFGKGGIEGH